jgi:hypothetical protein
VWVLERRCQVIDPPAESFQTHALCEKCHNHDVLINARARTFLDALDSRQGMMAHGRYP